MLEECKRSVRASEEQEQMYRYILQLMIKKMLEKWLGYHVVTNVGRVGDIALAPCANPSKWHQFSQLHNCKMQVLLDFGCWTKLASMQGLHLRCMVPIQVPTPVHKFGIGTMAKKTDPHFVHDLTNFSQFYV